MFSELLSKALDGNQVAKAHPSYPAIIRQLSSDEALVLGKFWQRQSQAPYKRNYTMELRPDGRFYNQVTELDEFPAHDLAFPTNLNFYIDHLFSLGLAGVYKDDEQPINTNGKQTGTRVLQSLRLTPMGVRFMEAVSATSRASPP